MLKQSIAYELKCQSHYSPMWQSNLASNVRSAFHEKPISKASVQSVFMRPGRLNAPQPASEHASCASPASEAFFPQIPSPPDRPTLCVGRKQCDSLHLGGGLCHLLGIDGIGDRRQGKQAHGKGNKQRLGGNSKTPCSEVFRTCFE